MTLPIEDLNWICENSKADLMQLQKKKLFVTGATGFIGKWLCETLIFANEKLHLEMEIHALSRNWDRFQKQNPNFPVEKMILHNGDVENFKMDTPCSIVFLGANAARPQPDQESELEKAIVRGTQNILKLCKSWNSETLILFGSGAVYSSHPPPPWKESAPTGNSNSLYSQLKNQQEQMIRTTALQTRCIFLRCFSFIGPYLPLEGSFAAGQFLKNRLNNESIDVRGTGTPQRSFLYAGEMIRWILAATLRGKNGEAYNVGSDQPTTIAELAQATARLRSPELEVRFSNEDDSRSVDYIPNVEKANFELGLKPHFSLETALEKTLKWHEDRLR